MNDKDRVIAEFKLEAEMLALSESATVSVNWQPFDIPEGCEPWLPYQSKTKQ